MPQENLNINRVIWLLGGLMLLVPWIGTAGAAEPKPNILIILADDLGYGELSCQGNPQIPTPHIDSLAKNGVRFTSGYVSGPYCSPTRAGLMTGRYQQRYGHEFNPGPAQASSEKFGLSLKEKTMGDRLKAPSGGVAGPGELMGKATAAGAQLYNLREDLGEKHDLAEQSPGKARELAGAWEKWNSELVEPAWLPARQGARRRGAQ